MATSPKTRTSKPATSSNSVLPLAVRRGTTTPSRRPAPSDSRRLVARVLAILPGAKRTAKPSPAESLAAALERATGEATACAPLTKGRLGTPVGGDGAVTAAKRRHTIALRRPQEEIMDIPKDQILQLLRDRGDHDNAQQADQQLPDKVDPEQHSDLLAGIGIKPDELAGDIGKKLGL